MNLPPLDAVAERPAPKPAGVIEESLRKELDSHRRAMPLQRLICNGMEYADAHALHAMVGTGVPWIDAGEWLAERNLARAREALAAGHVVTARSYFYYASACLRFAQVAIPRDTRRKQDLHRQMVDAFGAAASLADPPIRKVEIPWADGALSGWLMRPTVEGKVPAVIQFGGFDGWREEYHRGAEYLVERGIAVLLLDLPGQGETRLVHRVYLDLSVQNAVSAVIDRLGELSLDDSAIGVWGNSMGGYVAAAAAIADQRIVACCVNGGSPTPVELADRFPRYVEKLQALTGLDDANRALHLVRRMDLSERLGGLRCSLLQLHSVPDQVFLLENARRIHDLAASRDKRLVVWDDGDHCIYNHSHEKNTLVADWFLDQLTVKRNL
ncbi:alpha/beta hydrolase family protein [Burkholderia plantarii]|uniref:alpha/beta hydrolase family protein n=1 Tax=Burkholderia plantarii TaxID=41899 RepID=UPI0018DD943B|nr:alpha/beta fold hydrolase [Burkholderia plantarii]MBI0331242.1 alpha/beta fold hydrolase [Burkholderia plantarii]